MKLPLQETGSDEEDFLRAATRLRNGSVSAEDLSCGLQKLGKVMAVVDFPPLPGIALIRMAELQEQFGCGRFFMPEWWRWRNIADNS